MKSHAARIGALGLIVLASACAKKSNKRAEVVECSSISLDAKGTTQCLVGLYHWKVAEAQKAATDRAHELDSIKTWQADSVWELGAAKHKRDLQNCAKSDDETRSCLLVAGWPLSRVKAAQDSLWEHDIAKHRRELQTCAAKRDMNL